MPTPLAMWDVWTPIAAQPVAFEPPSGELCAGLEGDPHDARASIAFATLTLAAGIRRPGDAGLDRRLPLDEPYRIPETTRPPSAR
jgi:S-adenosylmethionine:tRNA ribosyltransferase-isomerase